jgi:hypothetical protein
MINYKDFLIRQPLSKKDTTSLWLQLGEEYGIEFCLRDGSFRPVNEWLDDLYLKYTTDQALAIIDTILQNGNLFFSDLTKHRQ